MKVGILGGGQLARMLALAGYPLGLKFVFFDPGEHACAGDVGELIVADYDDYAALDQFASKVDIVTLDFENVPTNAVDYLSKKVPVLPRSGALAAAQDRLVEKQFFERLEIPLPDYHSIDSQAELEAGAAKLGYQCILKTRRFGYDGKGQVKIADVNDTAKAWETMGFAPAVLEQKIAFKREVSMIAARSTSGEMVFYPLTENRHKDGILVTSFAPAQGSKVIQLARDYTHRVLTELNYVGVLAIEFFDVGDRLLVNEMAPRVHNSGHWTIDGAVTSQFENHLRAILGWPLGGTDASGASAMINWIGAMPNTASALSYANAHWHDYAKSPRPGRKVGHVTINSENILSLQTELAKFAAALGDQLQESGLSAFNTGHLH